MTSTFVEDTDTCDGSAEAMTALGCNILVTDFINKFGYLRGQYPVFKVRAHNSDGWGTLSSPNSSGATVQT
jgi:hypothetical protein